MVQYTRLFFRQRLSLQDFFCFYSKLLYSLSSPANPCPCADTQYCYSPSFYSPFLSPCLYTVWLFPLLALLRVSLLDAALNGKSIHAVCLWSPKSSIQNSWAFIMACLCFKRFFFFFLHSSPLSRLDGWNAMQQECRGALPPAHAAVLERQHWQYGFN